MPQPGAVGQTRFTLTAVIHAGPSECPPSAPGEIRTPDLRFRRLTLEGRSPVVTAVSLRLGEVLWGQICRGRDMVGDMDLALWLGRRDCRV